MRTGKHFQILQHLKHTRIRCNFPGSKADQPRCDTDRWIKIITFTTNCAWPVCWYNSFVTVTTHNKPVNHLLGVRNYCLDWHSLRQYSGYHKFIIYLPQFLLFCFAPLFVDSQLATETVDYTYNTMSVTSISGSSSLLPTSWTGRIWCLEHPKNKGCKIGEKR